MNSVAQIAKEMFINLKLRMLTLNYSHDEIMESALKKKKKKKQWSAGTQKGKNLFSGREFVNWNGSLSLHKQESIVIFLRNFFLH